MKLRSVYDTPGAYAVLWQLLSERTPNQNISHRQMPTWEEHTKFVQGKPYAAWYLFHAADGQKAGTVYLTHQREIGVGVLKAHQRQGLARQAVTELMRLHPGRFLANINPANHASIALFNSLGFGGPIQITLERPE
jgi:RimJ/RimL family protein N-acetyltransferase